MPSYRRNDTSAKPILNKTILISLFFTLCIFPSPSAFAATVNLAWNASTGSNLAGYKIYYGTSSQNYAYDVNVGKSTSCNLSGLQEGKKYYFSATAYNTNNVESAYSSEISYTVPFSNSDIIIDNGDPGTSSKGAWLKSGGSYYHGSNSLYSKQVGATYTFQAAANGIYEVSLWWSQWPSRDPSVPVRIYDGNTILDTIWINQTENGGQWNPIGSYDFSGIARIVIESETTKYSTCADAVLFRPLNKVLVIDNGDPGTSSKGAWLKSGGSHYHGSDSLYSKQVGATYTFQAAANGIYDVSLWWTNWPSRDPSVPVRIYDGNTILDKIWIDQTENGGQWNPIGSYDFSGIARIVIESETTNYSTCADAVMLSQ